MISFSSIFGGKKRQPRTIKTWVGWYAIINRHGQLSEIKPNKVAAQAALASRGDNRECEVVPIEITIKRDHVETPQHLIPQKKKTRRKKK